MSSGRQFRIGIEKLELIGFGRLKQPSGANTMNDRIDLPTAREVCPTTARRLLGEGALLVEVRERIEVEQPAIDVPELLAHLKMPPSMLATC